ncbi:MAG: phosphoribosylformylglycinamidine synthase subunit PurQ, partial [Clostridia bacterium]|nr:phosphoribosylformylglycinamidine synthase subunit PurQ [Clostridia bacterium]
PVYWFRPAYDANGLPETASLLALYKKIHGLVESGRALAVYTPGFGGAAEAIMKMGFGNRVGFAVDTKVSLADLFGYAYGSFLVEVAEPCGCCADALLGWTTDAYELTYGEQKLCMCGLYDIYAGKLEGVYPTDTKKADTAKVENICAPVVSRVYSSEKFAKPRVLIPAFPGTNCEYDTAKALENAGFAPEIVVIRNLTSAAVADSVAYFADKLPQTQVIFVPGGFSGGDEPDGSGKFITAFFRNGIIKERTNEMLKVREGLMCGICNGFQAIVKLGLVPFGEIVDTDENCPTLTFNTIGRHQSRIVRTRIASNKSPWLAATNVGDVYNVAISHGEGRFIAPENVLADLVKNGQVATQYVDLDGNATMDMDFNPNGSLLAIEGITSPDGRVLGKMGHTERWNAGLYQNVPGNYDPKLFESARVYFG